MPAPNNNGNTQHSYLGCLCTPRNSRSTSGDANRALITRVMQREFSAHVPDQPVNQIYPPLQSPSSPTSGDADAIGEPATTSDSLPYDTFPGWSLHSRVNLPFTGPASLVLTGGVEALRTQHTAVDSDRIKESTQAPEEALMEEANWN